MINSSNLSSEATNNLSVYLSKLVDLSKKSFIMTLISNFFGNYKNFIQKTQNEILLNALEIMEVYKQAMEYEIKEVQIEQSKKNIVNLKNFIPIFDQIEKKVSEDKSFFEDFNRKFYQNTDFEFNNGEISYYNEKKEKIIFNDKQKYYYNTVYYWLNVLADNLSHEEMEQVYNLIKNKEFNPNAFAEFKALIEKKITNYEKIIKVNTGINQVNFNFFNKENNHKKQIKEKNSYLFFNYFIQETGARKEMKLINNQIFKAQKIWNKIQDNGTPTTRKIWQKIEEHRKFYEEVLEPGFLRDVSNGSAYNNLFLDKKLLEEKKNKRIL